MCLLYPFCSRYAVPETPFSIPVAVTREELTTLINQLLEGEIYFKARPPPSTTKSNLARQQGIKFERFTFDLDLHFLLVM